MGPGKLLTSVCLFLFLNISALSQKFGESNIDSIFTCDQFLEKIIQSDGKNHYHGTVKTFYKNGWIASVQNYNHGMLDGPSVFFNDRGDTLSISTWKQNILHGRSCSYYSNCKRMFTENYFAGKLDGPSVYFDEAGKPVTGEFANFHYQNGKYYKREVHCTNGNPENELFVYDGKCGQLTKRINFKNGQPESNSFSYQNSELIAISLYEKGKYQKEADQNYPYHVFIYNNFLREDPDNEHFLYLRAIAQLRIGATQKALDDLDKVILVNKENYKAYYNRAVILGDSLPKVAMKDLAQTLKINKDFHLAYYNFGVLYYRDGQYKKARDNFESCIRLSPTHLPSIHNLAMIYGLLGDKNMEEYYKNEFKRIRSHK